MKRPRDLLRAIAPFAFAFPFAFVVALGTWACRKDPPAPMNEASTPSEQRSGNDEAGAEGALTDGSAVKRSVEERAEEARREAGTSPSTTNMLGDGGAAPIEPSCASTSIDLLAAALDSRCVVSESEWNALTHAMAAEVDSADSGAGAGKTRLRQEARLDGELVLFSIVNRSARVLDVPLRVHEDRIDAAFSVLAEDAQHAVFELVAPHVQHRPVVKTTTTTTAGAPMVGGRGPSRNTYGIDAIDGGPGAGAMKVHSARIRIPPNGSAWARLAIDPAVLKRLDRACDGGMTPAGDCAAPARLSAARYTLFIGQMIVPFDTGLPARVEWTGR